MKPEKRTPEDASLRGRGADVIVEGDEGHGAAQANRHQRTRVYPDPAPRGLLPRSMVDEARLAFLERAEIIDRIGLGLPIAEVEAHAGAMGAVTIRWTRGRSWEFDSDGEDAIGLEVYDFDDETVIDVCAFSASDPGRFGTILSAAPGLGSERLRNPATFYAGKALHVFRTPLAWLRVGCAGAVMLCPLRGPAWLAEADGPLLAEDAAHARELARLLRGLFDPDRILVQRGPRRE